MSCLRLHSRCGVPTAPRKYLLATIWVAFIDQAAGNSTPFCSKLTDPSRQLVMTMSRRSHSTSSYGCTPGVVKMRWIFSPLRRPPPLRAVAPVVSVMPAPPDLVRAPRRSPRRPVPPGRALLLTARARGPLLAALVPDAGGLPLGPQPGDLLLEVGQRLEAAVDRRELHVGDLVQLLQRAEDGQADLVRGHLGQAPAADLLLHPLAQHGQGVLGDRAALAGAADAGDDLGPGERLGDARALLHHQQDRLLGGEPPPAFRAGAAAADRRAVVGGPAVDHPAVRMTAERTVHAETPPCAPRPSRAGPSRDARGGVRSPLPRTAAHAGRPHEDLHLLKHNFWAICAKASTRSCGQLTRVRVGVASPLARRPGRFAGQPGKERPRSGVSRRARAAAVTADTSHPAAQTPGTRSSWPGSSSVPARPLSSTISCTVRRVSSSGRTRSAISQSVSPSWTTSVGGAVVPKKAPAAAPGPEAPAAAEVMNSSESAPVASAHSRETATTRPRTVSRSRSPGAPPGTASSSGRPARAGGAAGERRHSGISTAQSYRSGPEGTGRRGRGICGTAPGGPGGTGAVSDMDTPFEHQSDRTDVRLIPYPGDFFITISNVCLISLCAGSNVGRALPRHRRGPRAGRSRSVPPHHRSRIST